MERDIKIKNCKRIETYDSSKKPNGWVLELFSDSDDFVKNMNGQCYLATANPGCFKGFHMHALADYFLICLKGSIKETVYIKKDDKKDFDMTGEKPEMVFIPKGCPHGFKNIGNDPASVIIYRYPSWTPEIKEQLDIAPEEINTTEAWLKIKKFKERLVKQYEKTKR